jgi:hypothetical protein
MTDRASVPFKYTCHNNFMYGYVKKRVKLSRNNHEDSEGGGNVGFPSLL